MFRIGIGLHTTDLFVGFTSYMMSGLPPSFPDDPTDPLNLLTYWDITNSDGITVPDLVGDTEGPAYDVFNGRGKCYTAQGADILTVTGLLATDTMEVPASSAVPVLSNDTITFSAGLHYWGMTVKRAGVVIGFFSGADSSGGVAINSVKTGVIDNGAITTSDIDSFHDELMDGGGFSYTESGMTISDGVTQYFDELHTQLIPAGVFIPPAYESTKYCMAYLSTGELAPLQYKPKLKQPLRIVSVPCLDVTTADTFIPSESVTVASTEGTAVLSSDGTTITTNGTLYTITLSNGEILDCAEGNGSKLYSRTGDTTFAITTTGIETLRAGVRPEGSPDPRIANGYWHIDGDDTFYPFSIATSTKGEPWEAGTYKVMETPEIINVDAGQGFYTDQLTGEALPFNTADLDELGVEKAENGDFVKWTDPTVPDGFTKEGTHDANNYAEESPADHLHLVSSGTYTGIRRNDAFVIGLEYEYTLNTTALTGIYDLRMGGSVIESISSTGVASGKFIASSTTLAITRNSGACDATIDSISIREVNPFINFNKQYYWSRCKGDAVYDTTATDEQNAEITPWFFCDSLKGCDASLTIGTLTGTLKPSYFDGAVIDDIIWETTGDTITIEMATGYTPTNPYMGLTVAGLSTVLGYDSGSNSFIASGSHASEDAAIVAYLEANSGEVACVKMTSKAAQAYNVVNEGKNVVNDGKNVTFTGIPR